MHRIPPLVFAILLVCSAAGCAPLPASHGLGTVGSCPPDLPAADTALRALDGDRPPQLRQTPTSAPQFIGEALRRGDAGRIELEAIVDTTGRVEPCSIRVRSTTDSAAIPGAIAYVRSLRFEPSMRAGRPVRAWVRLPYVWNRERG
jgi:TonB family protein